ncbi:MAG: N-acyl-D-amino-acid deacylase [Candidatus Binatia bacterium]|jgi:N-acyl-D-amino-acid deacylase
MSLNPTSTNTAARLLILLLSFVAAVGVGASPSLVPESEIREAAGKALPLLENSTAFALKQRACFTCHHGSFPLNTFNAAWKLGFKIKKDNLERQLDRILERLAANLERYETDPTAHGDVNGEVDAVGHSLWVLDKSGYVGSRLSERTVDILLDQQSEAGFWEPSLNRPPTVGSAFTSTFVALRAINRYASDSQRPNIQERNARALKWLKATAPYDTEDGVYRLRALHLLEKGGDAFKAQAKALLDSQNEDGGWTQVADWRRDAYATGTALATLHDTGVIVTDNPAYQAGIRYLLKTQDRQGVWHVGSRTRAVQPFFGSGFPYERDQFISISGTAWAAYALLVALPEGDSQSKPDFLSVHSGLLTKSYGRRAPVTEEQTRFFNEKIQPILADKCFKCHSAKSKKLKADLYLDSAMGLRAGGENGPTLVRGKADESLLIQALLGKDLSLMPPKHPLSDEVIQNFKDWISAGAPDPR